MTRDLNPTWLVLAVCLFLVGVLHGLQGIGVLP
jgi:hypothetical protein